MADINVTIADSEEIDVTIGDNDIISVALEATPPTDHSILTNLDYDGSGHTNFQKKLIYDNFYRSFLIE